MVDKEIRRGFREIRKKVSEQERYILKADIKADKERDRLKRKLQKA